MENLENDKAEENIDQVTLPKMDPVYGTPGPLMKKWWVP